MSLLSSNRQLWEDPKVRLEKVLWPKLFSWLSASNGRELAFVLPLLATAPTSSAFGPSVAKFVDLLAAAFLKAADSNKVRALAAEVTHRKNKKRKKKKKLKQVRFLGISWIVFTCCSLDIMKKERFMEHFAVFWCALSLVLNHCRVIERKFFNAAAFLLLLENVRICFGSAWKRICWSGKKMLAWSRSG